MFQNFSYSNARTMANPIGASIGRSEYMWDRSTSTDVNRDGIPEIIISSANLNTNGGNDRPYPMRLVALSWVNGTLTDVTNALLPSTASSALLRNFIVADFNGDGSDDIFLNNTGSEATFPHPGEQNRILMSTANGTYVDKTANLPQLTDFSHGSVAADFDRDGDIDLFVNNLGDDQGITPYLLLNDGVGNFSQPLWMTKYFQPRSHNFSSSFDNLSIGSAYHPHAIDMGNDGKIDIYYGPIYTYETGSPVFAGFGYMKNNGSANFDLIFDDRFSLPTNQVQNKNEAIPEFTQSGDVDNDGDDDLIVYWTFTGNINKSQLQYFRNDREKGYTDVSFLIQGQESGNKLEYTTGQPQFQLVDGDGDGDLDIFLSLFNANFTQQISLNFENIDGAFKRVDSTRFPASQVFYVDDINGDIIPDIVYGVSDWSATPNGLQTVNYRLGEINGSVTRSGWRTDDTIAGGSGNDLLRGLAGRDFLFANSGNDSLIGDGPVTLSTEAQSVRRLYIATLDRAPDDAGWQGWVTAREGGQALTDIASGFVGSAEFQQKYGNLNNTQFVQQLYRNVLDREADQGGLDANVNALNAGAITRTQIVVNFSESAEFARGTSPDLHAGQIYRLYGATLARAPDTSGFEGWADATAGGRGLVDIAGGFVGSAEFQQRYGALDNTAFVTLLYQNVLGRAPDAGGLAGWTSQLDSGALTRTQVVTGFSESGEYINGTRAATDAFVRTTMIVWSDTLVGGEGDDKLTGGRGSDRFEFTVFDGGSDTVYGFDSFDTLELNGFGFLNSSNALAAMSQQGANVVLNYNGGSITFADTQLSTLQSLTAQGWILG